MCMYMYVCVGGDRSHMTRLPYLISIHLSDPSIHTYPHPCLSPLPSLPLP